MSAPLVGYYLRKKCKKRIDYEYDANQSLLTLFQGRVSEHSIQYIESRKVSNLCIDSVKENIDGNANLH